MSESQKLNSLFYAPLRLASRILARLLRASSRLERAREPADIQRRRVIASTGYSMVDAADEPYYAEQYWRVMRPHLDAIPRDASVLDLGCGQGRFSLRLAELCPAGNVLGCDISARAIDEAKKHAARKGVGNAHFRVQPVSECLATVPANSIDVILMTEVTFFYPDWAADLPRVVEKLKRGGTLVMSFRPQYFDALRLVRDKNWPGVDGVVAERRGAFFGSSTVYTWQTSAEVESLLRDDHGLEVLELRGVGVCSGINTDPHDYICQPSKLSEDERGHLMRLELELGKSVPDGGRYILGVARKPGTA